MSVMIPISQIKKTEPTDVLRQKLMSRLKLELGALDPRLFGALSHHATLEAKVNLKQIKTITLPSQTGGIHSHE